MAELTWAVVIPAYNAAANIAAVIEGCSRHLSLDRILVVDDGSQDATAEIAVKAGAQLLKQSGNGGKGRALRAGFKTASAWHPDWIICLDADGQHQPDNIPAFQKAASTGQYGMIIGNRLTDTASMPPARRFSNSFSTQLLNWRTGMKLLDVQCGYRALRTSDLALMHLKSESYEIEVELILQAWRLGVHIGWVPVPALYQDEVSYLQKLPETLRFLKLYLRTFYASK